MQYISGDDTLDYPVVSSRGRQKWLMSIYAEYHTSLFPDSKLNTEKHLSIQDVSHTNSIHKVYVGGYRDFPNVHVGDCMVIYRCVERDIQKPAWFGPVATSLCVVDEITPAQRFQSAHHFVDYCKRYSVFDDSTLHRLLCQVWNIRRENARIILRFRNDRLWARWSKMLLCCPPCDTAPLFGVVQASWDAAFSKILELGGVREGFVIH